MFSRFAVKGGSMLPSFQEGDFVVTRPVGKLKEGDVVVVRWEGRALLKRVLRVSGEGYFLGGDNKKASSPFGPVRKEQIVGKVWIHSSG